VKKCLLKKSICLTLGLAFGLGVSATALAADVNPFVDVPANHWSYAAVTKLAKDGIVDGYGDKTFRGDKTISRYEMAQIVAKAVDREDKADAADRAMIDKLAKEYSSELKGLNARVTKLEQNSIKFNGDMRMRYQGNWDARNIPPYNVDGVQRVQERIRLGMSSALSKDVDAFARISAQSYTREDMPPWAGDTRGTFGFDVAKVTFKDVLGGSIELGRNTLTLGQGLVADTPGNFDAAKYNFGGKEIKGFVSYGDISPATYWPGNRGVVNTYSALGVAPIWPIALSDIPEVPVVAANLSYKMYDNLTFTAGALIDENAHIADYPYQVYSLGMKAKMDTVTLTAEASRNDAANDQGDAFATSLMYKGAEKSKVGSFGFGVGYNKFEANSLDPMLTNMTGMFNSPGKNSFPALYGAKGVEYSANYTFTKNGILSASVANYKTISNGAGEQQVNTSYNPIGLNTTLSTPSAIPTGTKYRPVINVKAEFSF